MEPIIRIRNASKAYPIPGGELLALKNINLDVNPGEFLGIIGKSGAGKTTLINAITGVDHLSSGEVWVDSTPIHQLNEDQLALWRGQKLGIIYQSFYLMPSLTLLQNVLLPMDFNGLFQRRKSATRAMQLLDQVEMAANAYKLPAQVSGGQNQRAAIARALANDPSIIIADEPTGRLDSLTAETIFRVFSTLVEQGKTILMVTHDRSLASRMTRVISIADGELIQ
jgi:putative ABC transport system ATP-binding protein